MIKAKRNQKRYLAIFLASLSMALILTVISALLLIRFHYLPAIICAAVSAVGYYLFVFMLFAFLNARTAVRFVEIAKELGTDRLEDISDKLGWKLTATEKFMKKCKKCGYIA